MSEPKELKVAEENSVPSAMSVVLRHPLTWTLYALLLLALFGIIVLVFSGNREKGPDVFNTATQVPAEVQQQHNPLLPDYSENGPQPEPGSGRGANLAKFLNLYFSYFESQNYGNYIYNLSPYVTPGFLQQLVDEEAMPPDIEGAGIVERRIRVLDDERYIGGALAGGNNDEIVVKIQIVDEYSDGSRKDGYYDVHIIGQWVNLKYLDNEGNLREWSQIRVKEHPTLVVSAG